MKRNFRKTQIIFFCLIIFALPAISFSSKKNATQGGVTLAERSAEFPSDAPLHLGNPSRAAQKLPHNYLLQKSSFAVSYNDTTHTANWVAWHLCAGDIGSSGRSDSFFPDTSLPADYYVVRQNDFQFSKYGFERGHLCPSADRTSDAKINRETFLMTNIVPQAPDSNGGAWNDLEQYARRLARRGNELYIFAGTAGIGGTSKKGGFDSIALRNGRRAQVPLKSDGTNLRGFETDSGFPADAIVVPEYLWKIIVVLPEGDDDINRITARTTVIAAMIPNAQGCNEKGSWDQYITTVDEIEFATGLDFFDLLDDKIESVLEARRFNRLRL